MMSLGRRTIRKCLGLFSSLSEINVKHITLCTISQHPLPFMRIHTDSRPSFIALKVTCIFFHFGFSVSPAVEALVAALRSQDPTEPGERHKHPSSAPSSPSCLEWDLGLSYPTEIPSLFH